MKAVLVLPKIPGGCVECTLARMNVDGEMICSVTEKEANFIIGVDKPGSCPLRPMPKKAKTNQKDDEYYQGLVHGRNEVIEELEGSGEDA